MSDAVIDTNVMIVASLAHAGAAAESHRSADECSLVFEWLAEFHESSRCLILDNDMHIYDEYRHKLSDQDFAMLVVHEKLRHARLHEIEYEDAHDRAAVVPPEFDELDRSDRKFLAAALADHAAGYESVIVNATDTEDWRAVASPCAAAGVEILHLLDGD